MKHRNKKNFWIFLALILIFIVVGGAYHLREAFIHNDHKKVYSSDQPTKTSVSNGYVEQKGEEAAVEAKEVAELEDKIEESKDASEDADK